MDTFKLIGHSSIRPPITSTTLSGDMSIEADIDEELALTRKYAQLIQLVTDGAQVVSLGGITLASLIIIKTDNPIIATFTSTAGSGVVPIGRWFSVITEDVPVTAISLQRPSGILTNVRLTLGQL